MLILICDHACLRHLLLNHSSWHSLISKVDSLRSDLDCLSACSMLLLLLKWWPESCVPKVLHVWCVHGGSFWRSGAVAVGADLFWARLFIALNSGDLPVLKLLEELDFVVVIHEVWVKLSGISKIVKHM